MTNQTEIIREAQTQIVKEAARLATGKDLVSEYQRDWGVKVPASVLHQIEKQNERLRSQAQRLKKIYDSLSALSGITEWRPIEECKDKKMYLTLVDTDYGRQVHVLEFDGENWIYEGEPTFCQSMFFSPVFFMELEKLPSPPKGARDE